MARLKSDPVVVIGDVVGSRAAPDRAVLHDELARALAVVNVEHGTDLRITVGDEYQGEAPTLGSAITVSVALRVALLPRHDVRHGIGRGAVRLLDPATGVQDGPGWWAARAAIDDVRDRQRGATPRARTGYRVGSEDPADHVAAPAVDAALLALDELLGGLDGRGLSVLGGLMAGRTQREIAEQLGVSASAVSQRVRNDGIGTVTTMLRTLAALS